MARGVALAAAVAVSLLAVSGAGGAGEQTPKRGGTVVIAEPAFLEPACLNAFVDACSSAPATVNVLSVVFDGAFEVKPDATFRPNLVSRVDIVSKQPFTLLYHIRAEARWSDDHPITARDFAFTHDAIRKLGSPDDDSHRTKVRSVRPVDANTVKVVLRAPFVDWPVLFPFVLPRHALAGEDLATVWSDRITNPKTGSAIGSGPFLVGSWERGRRLTLVRNRRYWGAHPAYLDRLVYRFLPPEEAADALRRGEVDMIDPGPFTLQAAALELRRQRAPGISVVSLLGSAWEHLDIRMGSGGHPALRGGGKGKLVRQAIVYGIDREEIARVVRELIGDRTVQSEPLDSVVFLANSRHYEPSWKGYRYRPAQAQRLLEQAGCSMGADRIYVCAGEKLSLRFFTAAGVERRKRTFELAQEHLRRIGVELIPQYVPPSLVPTMLERRDFDLFQFSWIGGASTAGPLDVFGCQRGSNFTGYCDRLVTRDLDQATRIVDDQRRVRLLHKVDARLAKAVPAVPLFQVPGLFAFDANIRGVIKNGVGPVTWNAEDWWLAE